MRPCASGQQKPTTCKFGFYANMNKRVTTISHIFPHSRRHAHGARSPIVGTSKYAKCKLKLLRLDTQLMEMYSTASQPSTANTCTRRNEKEKKTENLIDFGISICAFHFGHKAEHYSTSIVPKITDRREKKKIYAGNSTEFQPVAEGECTQRLKFVHSLAESADPFRKSARERKI